MTVADEDLGMLPYYMGIKGEEDCGPVGVYDASWAVNKNASEKDKKATLDFIKWMITDNEAKKILSKDMGFSVPFTTFTDDYQPDNPLTEAARAYSNDGKTEVRSSPFRISSGRTTSPPRWSNTHRAPASGTRCKARSWTAGPPNGTTTRNRWAPCRKRRSSTQRADAIRLVEKRLDAGR